MVTVHTMEELHFTGNCLKGSRPILSFDATFDSEPYLAVIKELLLHTFGVPKSSRKTKPFVDHVMGFTVADGRVWVRCYQIDETLPGKQKTTSNSDAMDTTPDGATAGRKSTETKISLVEIGPRFVMTPIVIQESSFGGPILYENKEFVSPNQLRADQKISRAAKRNRRVNESSQNTFKYGELGLKSHGGRKKAKDPLDDRTLFA